MVSIDPKVSKDANGKTKSVTFSVEDWDQVLDELEELEDIRAFDEALADDSPSIPFEEALAEIEKNKLSD